MEYKFNNMPSISDLSNIYLSCGWSAYLEDKERFEKAMKSS